MCDSFRKTLDPRECFYLRRRGHLKEKSTEARSHLNNYSKGKKEFLRIIRQKQATKEFI